MSATRTIDRLERLTSSAYGNPRYRVHFTDGSSAVTMSDAGFVYAINNPAFRDKPVSVTFTRAGRISDISPLAGAR